MLFPIYVDYGRVEQFTNFELVVSLNTCLFGDCSWIQIQLYIAYILFCYSIKNGKKGDNNMIGK